jgi:hypothetical protein
VISKAENVQVDLRLDTIGKIAASLVSARAICSTNELGR